MMRTPDKAQGGGGLDVVVDNAGIGHFAPIEAAAVRRPAREVNDRAPSALFPTSPCLGIVASVGSTSL